MPPTIERGRLTARVPLKVQETLELAASLVGSTVNQFIVQTALQHQTKGIARTFVAVPAMSAMPQQVRGVPSRAWIPASRPE